MRYLLSRLREASTWAGLIGLSSVVGIYLNPALTDAIIAAGTAAASLALTVLPDGAAK